MVRRRKLKLNLIIKSLSTILCMVAVAYAFYNEKNNFSEDKNEEKSVLVSDEITENETIDNSNVSNTEDNDLKNNDNKQEDKSFDEALKNQKISNVLISKIADKNVTLFYYGEEKSFQISNAEELKDYVGQLCDIETEDGVITKVTFNCSISQDYFLYCEEGYMVFENAGKIPVSDDFVIIEKNSKAEASYSSISDASLNNEKLKVQLYIKDDKVSGIIYTGTNLETISVLIKNNNYTSINHSNVVISSKNGINVKTYNNTTKVKTTKGVKSIKVDSKDDFSRMVITGVDNSLLTIGSLKRCENITYYGSMTIINTDNGLVLVNTLPLEKYLYGVLTSEMPASFGQEAYKAQAICARTYALGKMSDYRYKEYGAALDDSTTYQVYNKNPRTKEAIAAVDATKGLVLVYKEKLASTCYFSTSCGCTASVNEVFGGDEAGNMLGKIQTVANAIDSVEEDNFDIDNTDLSGEKEFKEYIDKGFKIRDEGDEEFIEENCNWYRWRTNIQFDRLEGTHEGGKWDVGNISKISVKTREKSGVVSELIVKGNDGEIVIEGQSDIRKYLAPINENVICKGETDIDTNKINETNATRENMKLLPSGFFYVNESDNGIDIVGGGYGHGAGMSQYGAMWLSKAGFNYEEILGHYFNDCIIVDSITRLINP